MFRILALGAALLAAPAAQTLAQNAAAIDYSVAQPASGQWSYAATAGGSRATFAAGQATITCTRAQRRIAIARTATGAAPYLFVWASSMNRNVPAGYDPATRLITAQLSAYDKLLDALAFSRGRIALAPSNGAPLVLPAWPDIIRVIEDCRV